MTDAIRQEPTRSYDIEVVAEKKSSLLAERAGFEYPIFA